MPKGRETVTPTTSGYNLRPRIGKREESRPTIERKAQQGGPVRSRKGRERNDSPYIEERTRSSNKNARRGGDQQRQDQERRGTWTKKSLSLEVLVSHDPIPIPLGYRGHLKNPKDMLKKRRMSPSQAIHQKSNSRNSEIDLPIKLAPLPWNSKSY
ncbi:uncharacterized protein TNCV_213911 [Trichonephila clavipes]|nr:uncharacterized protein TNCV_213911 [Trichonephila clavipes]